jgi:flagellar assembly protein FliH
MTQWSNKPAPKSTSPYSRFIPREEIDAVAAWRFANVDGSPHADEVPKEKIPTPEAIQADMEGIRREALAEGFAQGHAAGCEETQQALQVPVLRAAQEATRRYDDILKVMREQLTSAQEQMAQDVLLMATELARQVIRRELAIDPQAIQPVLNEALGMLVTDTHPTTVRLHPDDFAQLEAGWTAAPDPNAPRFIADASITCGGCLVEAPGSAVDATVEKRWMKAVANLGLPSLWESGHADT